MYLLIEQLELGSFYADRTLLTNADAGLSTEPDALFVSWQTLRSQRVRPVPRPGHPGEYMELEGSPDWVLEVVSRSSVDKDTRLLRQAYHQAGVTEYWLINGLGDEIDFQILMHQTGGYVAETSEDGWHRSPLFGRRFRLERRSDPLGYWRYRLLDKADAV